MTQDDSTTRCLGSESSTGEESTQSGIRAGVDHYGRNGHGGRDLIVGDIHGAYTSLEGRLKSVGFDASKDRLFSVGDLIDRGPESHLVMEWLDKPWFHPVMGNHEDLAIAGCGTQPADHRTYVHMMNGGDWFYRLPGVVQDRIARKLAALPIVIELETAHGLVGLVHAECPLGDWADFTSSLDEPQIRKMALWSRERVHFIGEAPVRGVRAVVCGHTVNEDIVRHNGHIWIETAGWHPSGRFTLLDAATLGAL